MSVRREMHTQLKFILRVYWKINTLIRKDLFVQQGRITKFIIISIFDFVSYAKILCPRTIMHDKGLKRQMTVTAKFYLAHNGMDRNTNKFPSIVHLSYNFSR